MSIEQINSVSRTRQLWRWIKDQLIQDVPKDIATCEYDCRRGRCTHQQWETCERRLLGSSGELKPPSDANASKLAGLDLTQNDKA